MSPYLKGGGDSARRANRIRYFATRPGVEVLSDSGSQPATKKQKAYIQRLLRAFPDARELLSDELRRGLLRLVFQIVLILQ